MLEFQNSFEIRQHSEVYTKGFIDSMSFKRSICFQLEKNNCYNI